MKSAAENRSVFVNSAWGVLVFLLCLSINFITPGMIHAYSYSASTSIAKDGSITVVPGFDSVNLNEWTNNNLSLTWWFNTLYGVGKNQDVTISISPDFFSFSYRYDISGNNLTIIGLSADTASIARAALSNGSVCTSQVASCPLDPPGEGGGVKR